MIVSKYCASGNDFIIFHNFMQSDYSSLAIKLCNRHYGIGADGLVVLLPALLNEDHPNTFAYKWDFYNSDGSRADMCGNASRAVNLYAYHNKIAPMQHSFLSGAGAIETCLQKEIDQKSAVVQSKIGKYISQGKIIEHYNNCEYIFELIIMSIPHLVYFAKSNEEYSQLSNDLAWLSYLRYKYDANVNIALKSECTISYVTFERGVEGITQACGTGACAVYVGCRDFAREYTLMPPSKEKLSVSYRNDEIYFAGLVSKVCDCVV